MRQIHTGGRPESEVEQRYWRRMDRLRLCGQLLAGLIAVMLVLIFVYSVFYGGFLMFSRS